MIRYTTPTITLLVLDIDLTNQDIRVSLEQDDVELTKRGEDLTVRAVAGEQGTDTEIRFTLSQTESAKFNYNKRAQVQVNWIGVNNVRAATEIKSIQVMKNLLDEEIAYGN